MKKNFICTHFLTEPKCPGCLYWDIDLQTQQDRKKEKLSSLLKTHLDKTKNFEMHSVGGGHHRVWFDLQIRQAGIGLIDKTQGLIPIEKCLLMRPELQDLFSQLRTIKFPDKKISARIRVSPQGLKGLWLDLANIEIKELLTEKILLQKLKVTFDVIEMGQRRKIINFMVGANEQFKLASDELHPWFQTLGSALYSNVGSFTQPSWESADLITNTLLKFLSGPTLQLYEYGCGIGQYTIAFLQNGHTVSVEESDSRACRALEKNSLGFEKNLKIQSKLSPLFDVVVVNPPRSGLGSFCQSILDFLPRQVLYVSCSAESLKFDLDLLAKNYEVQDLHIVDQFPQSPHFESIVHLVRI